MNINIWDIAIKKINDKGISECTDGSKEWFYNDLKYKQTPIIYVNEDKFWYLNNLLHRLQGPAVEYTNGDKEWWKYGLRHRLNAPAIIRSNGKEFWEFGDFIK